MCLNYRNVLSSFAILSFTVATSSAALAADLDTSWEGLYGGITIGSLHGEADPDTATTDGSYFRTPNINKLNNTFQKEITGSSATASALVGYLKQHGNFLYGIEADLTVMDFNEKTSTTTGYTNGAGENNTETSIKSNLSLAIRPTIGYSFGGTMVQFGAGPVISRFNYNFNFSDFSGTSTNSEEDKTAVGLSADIGIKHRLDNNLILQVDYVYSHYSNVADSSSLLTNASGNSTNTDVFSHGSDFESHNMRIGLIKYF